MSERFRFDHRIVMPEVPDGMALVRCFGMPFLVSEALPGEPVLPSKLTETQQQEVINYIKKIGVDQLSDQKKGISQSGGPIVVSF